MRTVTLRVPVVSATAVAAGVLAGLIAGLPSSALASASGNPPGNDGTVKIDRMAFDDLPNNEPHVGCQFQVDFYGYDQGNLTAKVTFEAQPPTLPAGSDRVLLTDNVFIGQDTHAGGGSTAGLDASRTYQLDFTGITPQAQQGYHVKLTVDAQGSRGADVKHKVFWVTGCTPSSPPPSSPPSSPSSSSSGSSSSSVSAQGTPSAGGGSAVSGTEVCTEAQESGSCSVVSTSPGFTG